MQVGAPSDEIVDMLDNINIVHENDLSRRSNRLSDDSELDAFMVSLSCFHLNPMSSMYQAFIPNWGYGISVCRFVCAYIVNGDIYCRELTVMC